MAEDSEMIRVSGQVCATRHGYGAGSGVGLGHLKPPVSVIGYWILGNLQDCPYG
jgi:hypothetical protein